MADCEMCGPYGGLGCPMCTEGLAGAVTDVEAVIADTARAAWDEEGAEMVHVYCASCPDGPKRRRLGVVRRSSRGPVYSATLPGTVDMGPDADRIRSEQKDRARAAGHRLPFLGAVGVCIVLLEIDGGQDPTAAECPRHGPEQIPQHELLAAARHHEEREIRRGDVAPAEVLLIHQRITTT
jgi:hypothetical protein